MIRIDNNHVQLIAEFSHGIFDLIKAQAEAEEKPVLKLAPIMLAEITGAVFHAVGEDAKRKKRRRVKAHPSGKDNNSLAQWYYTTEREICQDESTYR